MLGRLVALRSRCETPSRHGRQVQVPHNAEVNQHRPAVPADEDVVWLDVAVNLPPSPHLRNGARHRRHELACLGLSQEITGLDLLTQGGTINVLHYGEWRG